MMGSSVGQDHHAHGGSNAFFQNLAVSKEDFFVVDFGNDVIVGSSNSTTFYFIFYFIHIWNILGVVNNCDHVCYTIFFYLRKSDVAHSYWRRFLHPILIGPILNVLHAATSSFKTLFFYLFIKTYHLFLFFF